jgi:hypothetical protein
MPTLLELEPQVMTLSERDRANLASSLLFSLPPTLHDEDEGLADALRRESEAESDAGVVLTLEEFKAGIRSLRGR